MIRETEREALRLRHDYDEHRQLLDEVPAFGVSYPTCRTCFEGDPQGRGLQPRQSRERLPISTDTLSKSQKSLRILDHHLI